MAPLIIKRLLPKVTAFFMSFPVVFPSIPIIFCVFRGLFKPMFKPVFKPWVQQLMLYVTKVKCYLNAYFIDILNDEWYS